MIFVLLGLAYFAELNGHLLGNRLTTHAGVDVGKKVLLVGV